MSTETLPAPDAADSKKRGKRGAGDLSRVESQPPQVTPPKLRRRPIMVASGVAAVSVGALLSVWAYTAASEAQSVIAARDTITRGELIQEEDLMAVSITVDPALRPIAASDASSLVIGKRAALDIAAGGVVTSEQVTDTLMPPAGESIVGVSLAAAMLPANQVDVGDEVRVVETPGPQAQVVTEEQAHSSSLTTVTATVVGVHTDAAAGTTIINLLVPEGDAPEVASWSAAARAAIVVDSTEQ